MAETTTLIDRSVLKADVFNLILQAKSEEDLYDISECLTENIGDKWKESILDTIAEKLDEKDVEIIRQFNKIYEKFEERGKITDEKLKQHYKSIKTLESRFNELFPSDLHDEEEVDSELEEKIASASKEIENLGGTAAVINKGVEYSKQGEYNKAIELYDIVITANPKQSRALYNKGWAYFKLKDYPKAVEFCEKAIDNDEENKLYKAWATAGRAIEKINDSSEDSLTDAIFCMEVALNMKSSKLFEKIKRRLMRKYKSLPFDEEVQEEGCESCGESWPDLYVNCPGCGYELHDEVVNPVASGQWLVHDFEPEKYYE